MADRVFSSLLRLGIPVKKSGAAPKRQKVLIQFILLSLLVHLVIGFILGNYVIWTQLSTPEPEFEAPPVQQANPPQPIRIELKKSSSAKPKELARVLTARVEDIKLPELSLDNINTNVGVAVGKGRYGGKGMGLSLATSMPKISFFGMESDGKDLLFVVDISGSMIKEPRGMEGFRQVAREVEDTLIKFTGQGRFNIIVFAADVDKFRGSLTPADEQAVKDAIEWLYGQDPALVVEKAGGNHGDVEWKKYKGGKHFGTNTGEALKAAIRQKPDTIFLLSDGKPFPIREKEVLALVDKLQEKGPVVPINTISYKSQEGRDFLRTLAEKNQGIYRTVN